MKKKNQVALLLLCGWLLAALPALGATEQRIFDQAGLLSVQEEQTLAQEITQFQQDTGMDFVLVTSNQAHGQVTQQTIADDFYDQGGFGLDEEKSGVCYYVDLYERELYVSTTGKMKDYLTDARIQGALDASQPRMTRGDYAGGASAMVEAVTRYIRAGIPEGQYQYDVLTGQRLTARHKALTSNELLLNLLIGAVVALVFGLGVARRYQLKGTTYQYDMRANTSLNMTDQDDQFLRSATTQMRRPDPPQGGGSGGGGGFGGGGGSGVHVGSSGTSHGGGGRSF